MLDEFRFKSFAAFILENSEVTQLQLFSAFINVKLNILNKIDSDSKNVTEINKYNFFRYELNKDIDSKVGIKDYLINKLCLSAKDTLEILNDLNSSGVVLGLGLVDLGILSKDEVSSMFLSFQNAFLQKMKAVIEESVADSANSTQLADQSSKSSIEKKQEKSITPIEDIAIPQFTFEKVDESLLQEFTQLFDATKHTELENIILNLKKDFSAESLKVLYRELHTLKGTAKFIKAFAMEHIIHAMENLLSEVIQFKDVLSDQQKEEFETIYLDSFDFCWNLRNSIESDLCEENFMGSSTNVKKMKQIVFNIQNLQNSFIIDEEAFDLNAFTDQF